MPIVHTNQPATEKQQSYIAILCNDLGFDKHRANAHIKSIINRKIDYLDELSSKEASDVITKFKEWKENKKCT